MLNGVAPILIFHFYNKDLTGIIAGLPVPYAEQIAALVGVPVPIYLDENFTGIYVDSETSGIDFSTLIEPVIEKNTVTRETKAPNVTQTALDSQITVNLFAKRDSILLTAILALSNMIMKRIVSAEYGITYLNRSTTIFNGLMHRFSTSVGANDDLIRIEMTLSNAKNEGTKPAVASVTPISKVVGALPL